MSSIIHQTGSVRPLSLQEREQPQLYRELFPYTSICRTTFDEVLLAPRPAEQMRITDTTFRDGQQARPPYTVKQVAKMFDFLHRMGGKTGLITASEFFLYSAKDRKCIDVCRARGYRFPRATAWIRANKEDLKLARDMEFDETGMLTSVSDYHIYLKLGKTRQQAMDMYLDLARQALEWGIIPRCHFEDVTRADIYGFCLPFAQKLMELSQQSGMPVKIRLCDTMGYGVPYPGAALPRSVQRIVRAFTDEAGVPGEWLEWHGHNDFHKVLVNGVTAWLNGCGAVNSTLFGFGERTGNTPLEALIIEYISLTGDDAAADTTILSEVAEFFEKELHYNIPYNYPFVGRDFNATSAGVHADGLAKNEEIYNIFDTKHLLGRPVPIIITDKTGRAGVAYWINVNLKLPEGKQISKKHPAVGQIYEAIVAIYDTGRTTHLSHDEMAALVQRYMPELFETEFDHMKELADELAAHLIARLAQNEDLRDFGKHACARLDSFSREYPFIQYLYLTDTQGSLKCAAITDPAYREKYEALPIGFDFSQREWFKMPMQTGDMHIMDVYQSQFTGKLVITVSCPVTDDDDNIVGVIHEKDFYAARYRGETMIRQLKTPVFYTTGNTKISELLRILQKNKAHMAVVVDEYGGTEGIATLEDIVEELAKYAGVPVFNGLTNEFHPTQILADFLTIREHFGHLKGINFVYFGDARYNMGNSLMVGCAKMGLNFTACAPKKYQPDAALVAECQKIAAETGATLTFEEDSAKAAKGADVLYTDVWVSMGEPVEVWAERINDLAAYQINQKLMDIAGPHAVFMHCLPAFHDHKTTVGKEMGERFGRDAMEVTDEVFEGPQSIVFDEAENRMHTIKAVMAATLGA